MSGRTVLCEACRLTIEYKLVGSKIMWVDFNGNAYSHQPVFHEHYTDRRDER